VQLFVQFATIFSYYLDYIKHQHLVAKYSYSLNTHLQKYKIYEWKRNLKFKNEIRSIETNVMSTLMGGGKIECATPKHWKGMRVKSGLIGNGDSQQ
jgi:hypothetical protein